MNNNDAGLTMIGQSAAIEQVKVMLNQVAKTQANVLILGSSGTGKELVAQNIHMQSKRSGGPFIPVNCAAIPADLLESELFGHEKGAFTGAIGTRRGRFEMAHGGTIFLDEIGDMPLLMQVKVLRVLQERTFERIGGTRSQQVDVRVIAATNKCLEQEVANNTFREDLYYRLNVFPINLPELCKRSEDIPALVTHAQKNLIIEESDRITFSNEAMNLLKKYQWPGNIRELFNLIERMTVMYPGKNIEAYDLPEKYQGVQTQDTTASQLLSSDKTEIIMQTANKFSSNYSLKDYLANIEKTHIVNALQETNWVVSKAAALLGLRRTTLVEKIKKYNLTSSEYK